MAQIIRHPGLEGIDLGTQYSTQLMELPARGQEEFARTQAAETARRNQVITALNRERDLLKQNINPVTGQPLAIGQGLLPDTYGQRIVADIFNSYIRDRGYKPGVTPRTAEGQPNPQAQVPNAQNNIWPTAMIPAMPEYMAKDYSQQQVDPATGRPIPGKTTPFYPPSFFYGK